MVLVTDGSGVGERVGVRVFEMAGVWLKLNGEPVIEGDSETEGVWDVVSLIVAVGDSDMVGVMVELGDKVVSGVLLIDGVCGAAEDGVVVAVNEAVKELDGDVDTLGEAVSDSVALEVIEAEELAEASTVRLEEGVVLKEGVVVCVFDGVAVIVEDEEVERDAVKVAEIELLGV